MSNARPLYELVVDIIQLAPLLPDGDDTLLSLEQAQWLPILGGLFDARSLAHAATRPERPLKTTILLGRRVTCRAWVREWIEGPCQQSKVPGSGMRKPETVGASSTTAKSSARIAAESSLRRLKSSSKRTS